MILNDNNGYAAVKKSSYRTGEEKAMSIFILASLENNSVASNICIFITCCFNRSYKLIIVRTHL